MRLRGLSAATVDRASGIRLNSSHCKLPAGRMGLLTVATRNNVQRQGLDRGSYGEANFSGRTTHLGVTIYDIRLEESSQASNDLVASARAIGPESAAIILYEEQRMMGIVATESNHDLPLAAPTKCMQKRSGDKRRCRQDERRRL